LERLALPMIGSRNATDMARAQDTAMSK